MRYLIILLVFVGCAPAKPAGCPIQQNREQEVRKALASVENSIERLETLDAVAGGVLAMFPGALEDYERALKEAREEAVELQRQLKEQ